MSEYFESDLPESEVPDYDDDDGVDDEEDAFEDYKQQETEKILDQQSSSTSYKPNNYYNPNNMQNNPFGQPVTPTYGGTGYQPQSPWATNPSPWSTPRYQPSYNPNPVFGAGTTSPWQTPVTQGAKQQLNRSKKIIFCDLLDNLIESIQSGGKLGVQPRGIFDIRLKFEVWDKISCLAPDYVFVLTNQNIVPGSMQARVFSAMTDYVMYSLAEYLRLPYQNCQCFTKAGFEIDNPLTKPNTGLISKALESIPDVSQKYKKEDMLVIGAMSGLSGQSNKDSLMAEKFKIDYIDIGQLLSIYF